MLTDLARSMRHAAGLLESLPDDLQPPELADVDGRAALDWCAQGKSLTAQTGPDGETMVSWADTTGAGERGCHSQLSLRQAADLVVAVVRRLGFAAVLACAILGCQTVPPIIPECPRGPLWWTAADPLEPVPSYKAAVRRVRQAEPAVATRLEELERYCWGVAKVAGGR